MIGWVFGLMCAIGAALPQAAQVAPENQSIAVDRGPAPRTLDAMAAGAELIVRGYVADAKSEDYEMPAFGIEHTAPFPTSVYRFVVTEVLRDTGAEMAGSVEGQVEARALGYLPSSKRGQVDPHMPELVPREEYVIFLLRKPPRFTTWLAYGIDGVFHRAGDAVEACGRGDVAREVQGIAWARFLVRLRAAAARAPKGAVP